MEFQLMEYSNLLALASPLDQPLLREALNNAKSRTLTMKRKYEQLFTAKPSLNEKNTNAPPPKSSTATTAFDRDKCMKSVAEFKRKREGKGEAMNWGDCWKEGTNSKILNYKNSESLRQQFTKYLKKQKQSLMNEQL